VFLEGMTCREAAEALDVPLGTVLSRIHRARQKIRLFFEDEANVKRSPPAGQNNADPPQQLRLGGGA
jgi:transposase